MAVARARRLRKAMTREEVKLWLHLRTLRARGFHFRRQAPIGRYIVDFVCFAKRIVIEVDGGQHGLPLQVRRDEKRDWFLRSEGFRVLRFWNSDVRTNSEGVFETILGALERSPPPRRTAYADPPLQRERQSS